MEDEDWTGLCKFSFDLNLVRTALSTNPQSNTSALANLTATYKETERLRQELEALKAQREKEQQQTISIRSPQPILTCKLRTESTTIADGGSGESEFPSEFSIHNIDVFKKHNDGAQVSLLLQGPKEIANSFGGFKPPSVCNHCFGPDDSRHKIDGRLLESGKLIIFYKGGNFIPRQGRYLCDKNSKKIIALLDSADRQLKQLSDEQIIVSELKTELLQSRELIEKLTALKAKQEEQQQQTKTYDSQIPLITATGRRDNQTNVIVSGRVTDNVAVAEVTIDGEPVRLGNDGSFSTTFYVPRSGKTVQIVAFDKKGNKATKSLFIERGEVQQTTGPVFASLNPSGKRVKSNNNALALIIGVADYQRTPAKAAYADKDAQTFYDYAMLKLGIPAGNIKELVNTDANEAELRLAVKDWIARATKQSQSDIYVFFAGHGLASDDGKRMYLLPVDGEPRLLDDTAISRERLFADISAANPRSVTVFLDTCYSGTTRGTDMLIASRPIAIRALEQSIPDNFTVMTAAAGDETAKPLEEAKHGMFSYFLMKGMEGEADANNDNEITAGELHSYVQINVIQQSSGSQTPELQGDADRVLVRFR